VFLDEPTGGVDPVSRRNFWELINSLSASGTTVFVTTHYLDEAEYCSRIMLIHAGKIIAGGSPGELKNRYIRNPILELECDKPVEAMALLQKQDWIQDTSLFGAHLHLNVEDEAVARNNLNPLLSENNITIRRIDRISPSLEDVFLHLIEKEASANI
jgi:ABC-2 type transport system ATP-binding protein